jgi:hypothetical protein
MNDHDHDNGLSPAAHAALAALRAEDDLPADARARVWARLAAEEAGPSDMSFAPARQRRGWAPVVLGLAIAAGVALALVGPGRGAKELAADTRPDAAAYDDAARAARMATKIVAPAPEVVPVTSAPTPILVKEEPRRPRERPVEATPPPVPEDSSTLAAETALLQRAQAALAAGDADAALTGLGEHAKRFADGVLARERDALRVTALCAAGRRAEGQAEAATFLRAHGDSLLAERVRGACDP